MGEGVKGRFAHFGMRSLPYEWDSFEKLPAISDNPIS